MLTRRAFAQLAVASLTSTAPAARSSAAEPAAPSAKPGSRAAEVLALREFVEHTSPRGLEAKHHAGWRRDWAAFQQRAGTLDDGRYVIGLRRLLAWFGEGHTTIVPFEFLGEVPAPLRQGVWGRTLALKALPFHDGLWITEASAEARSLLGTRIQAIGGQPIEQIVRAHAQAWPGENPAWAHNWAGLLASSVGTLHGLGVAEGPADSPLRIDGLRPDGSAASANLRPLAAGPVSRDQLERLPTLVERARSGRAAGNFVLPLDNARALYISIDEMADLEGLGFAQFTESVLAAMKSAQLQRLIIDLRRNGGGDNYLAEPLRHELARSRFNRPGGLCVLIGPATFSAAQNLANRLERECFASFIGEPTGSAPNLVGDAAYFVGKATGITAMVAQLRWFDGGPDDKRRWIAPDVAAPSRHADWLAGRDAALEAALAAPGAGNEGFASRTRYFERASQRTPWNPFWAPA